MSKCIIYRYVITSSAARRSGLFTNNQLRNKMHSPNLNFTLTLCHFISRSFLHFIESKNTLKVIIAKRWMKKLWSMVILIGCDISSEIPTSSNSALISQREKCFPPISSISLIQMSVLIWFGEVMWEIAESTILFTLMGNVFSPVNQHGGSFSQARSRNEEANRTEIWP